MLKVIRSGHWYIGEEVIVKPVGLTIMRPTWSNVSNSLTRVMIGLLIFIPIIGWYYAVKKYLSYRTGVYEKITWDKIHRFVQLNSENEKSITSKLGWAVGGAALAGGVGLLLGLLKSANVKAVVMLELKDGRSALIGGTQEEINEVIYFINNEELKRFV